MHCQSKFGSICGELAKIWQLVTEDSTLQIALIMSKVLYISSHTHPFKPRSSRLRSAAIVWDHEYHLGPCLDTQLSVGATWGSVYFSRTLQYVTTGAGIEPFNWETSDYKDKVWAQVNLPLDYSTSCFQSV